MVKFSFLKLLDETILPLLLLAGSRFLGVFLAALIFPVGFSFGNNPDLPSLPFIRFEGSGDLYLANSVSWGLVGLVLAISFGYVLFRILNFHGDRVHPKESSRLHNRNLEFLVIDSHEAFHQGISWVLAGLLSTCLVAGDFLSGQLSAAAFGFVFGVNAFLVLGFWWSVAGSRGLERKKV